MTPTDPARAAAEAILDLLPQHGHIPSADEDELMAMQGTIVQVIQRLAVEPAERASAADSRRLDWIEEKHPLGLLDVMSTDSDCGYGFTAITGDQTLYGSFREAIDAAIGEGEEAK